MTVMQMRRVDALPTTPEADTLYIVKVADSARFFVTGPSGDLYPVVAAKDDSLCEFLLMGVAGDG